jgi:hypothetical protein
MRPIILAGLVSLFLVPVALAQSFTTGPCDASQNRNGFLENRTCEDRRTTLPVQNGRVAVEGTNGGIEVIGEDRNDIALEAQVVAQAPTRDQVASILHDVHVITDGTIHAEGPHLAVGNWSVNFKLRVPRHIAAQLETVNGGVSLSALDGDVRAQTRNGGLSLSNLGGDIQATTVNGGVHVALEGDTWHGAGLVAKSVNGGVHITVPANYSAHLIASTVNGGAHIGLPFSGDTTHSRTHFDGNLGHGGPTLRVETSNGGISVD